jgi:type II secretory pathway component PulJ
MLADLLVAVSVLGLVMSANFVLLDQGQRAYRTGAARVESQQTARIALTRIARELRTAGSGVVDPSFAAISIAEPTRVTFHRDWNGDGVISGGRETVTWFLDGTILRRDAGGGAQPIVNGVRALAFAYFDADGAPTVTPTAVRSVKITLTTEGASTTETRPTTTVSTQVRLRNR